MPSVSGVVNHVNTIRPNDRLDSKRDSSAANLAMTEAARIPRPNAQACSPVRPTKPRGRRELPAWSHSLDLSLPAVTRSIYFRNACGASSLRRLGGPWASTTVRSRQFAVARTASRRESRSMSARCASRDDALRRTQMTGQRFHCRRRAPSEDTSFRRSAARSSRRRFPRADAVESAETP